MTHLQRIKILYWVSSNFIGNHKNPLWSLPSLLSVAENPRFYRTKGSVQTENPNRKEAQRALLDYFYYTRNLLFTDAENMSKNSPLFLDRLLSKVDIDEDTGQSVARFLRYHPINEFEPFFESSGLKPHEYSPFLRHDLMFLSDEDVLLENYHVLCNYGIPRNKIGKIYKEATQVFRYGYGMLPLKLRAYEDLGLSQSFMVKLVVCSPYLLIGDVNVDFMKVLEILRKGGVEFSRMEELLPEKSTSNWSQLLVLLRLFGKAGYNEEQLGGLLCQQPWILCEDSVDRILLLIGFILKFGCTMNQIFSILLQFPPMQVEKFVSNLRHCFLFLNEIRMEEYEIGKLFCSHLLLLGSLTLKKHNNLLSQLNAGKERICEVVLENPEILKKWVKGPKVEWLPNSGKERRTRLKTKFFSDLGFVENSDEMERAFKVVRGKAAELQERFNCIATAGLDRKVVCQMIRQSPQILGQPKDILEMKIAFLVNDMGYPISSLVNFPSYLKYSMQRVKLRLAVYNWLKNQGKADPMVPLSTIISYTDKVFFKRCVIHHPRGPEVWQELKDEIYCE